MATIGGSPLHVNGPSAYLYLTSASPYDIGSTLTIDDSQDVGGDYTLDIDLTGGGTLTLSGTTGLTGSGDGTSSLSYSGTTSDWNTALNGADIAGLSDETATMTIVMTRDADSQTTTRVISVTAYPALAILTLAPPDDSTDIAIDRATYTATFNRDIQFGTGDITLKLVGGAAVETFDASTGVGDQTGLMAISGASLVISPGVTLSGETEYAIQIAATAIDGSDIGTGDSFAGITNDTTWSFTTEDVAAPTISSLDPADGSTNHPIADPLVATFDENIAFGTGDIRLVETGVGTVETFNVVTETGDDGGTVAISTTDLTITPGSDLTDSTAYHVEIDATAIEDTSGNAFAGISDATTWNFEAVSGPSYIVNGSEPDTVADFSGSLNSGTEYYRTAGTETTFDSMFSYTGASRKTMTDSDGVLKWAPHNLALNSAAPATQSITVVSGADYTVEITGSGSVALTGAGTGTVTAGNPVEITASTTTLTLTVTGTPSTMWCYRSDLGGMVDNWDTGTSYVPTTTSAVHLPRRNSYRYNGTSYVNKGIYLDPKGVTNLISESNDFSTTWTPTNATLTPNDATGPDGNVSMTLLSDDSSTGTGSVYLEWSVSGLAINSWYTFSVYCAADQLDRIALYNTVNLGGVWFLLTGDGSVTTEGTSAVRGSIERVSSGIYRCAITFNTVSTTSGVLRIHVAQSDASYDVDLDGTSSVHIFGAQFENNAIVSGYIPTDGSTASIAGETLQIALADTPYNTTAISAQIQGEYRYINSNVGFTVSGEGGTVNFFRIKTDATNYIEFALATNISLNGLPGCAVEDSGTRTASNGSDVYSRGVNVPMNLATRIATNVHQIAVDGTANTNVTGNAPPTFTTEPLEISHSVPTTAGVANGYVQMFRMWGVDIGEAGIESASS